MSQALDVIELFPYQKPGSETIHTEDVEEAPHFIPHRLYYHHVDTFSAKYIASFLADQVYGALLEGEAGGEGEEDMAQGEEDEVKPLAIPLEKYQIIGTLKEPFHTKTEDISYVIDPEEKEAYNQELLSCGCMVFDISKNPDVIPQAIAALDVIEKELERVKEFGPKTYDNMTDVRVFILISSVITWALTKPLDPEDPDVAFTEADYKKRKCHPNYTKLLDCEREVVLRGRKYKGKLKTYVVCTGLTYGMEEDDLFFLFKMAWENEEYLPIFKPGKNSVPFIHIKDLAKIIRALYEKAPKKPQFILAVEETPCTLKQVVKALSKVMGTGKTKEVAAEEGFLHENITQRNYECCTLNLKMEPASIMEDLEVEWTNESNLFENMPAMVAEFKAYRNLKPLKVVLHGPPAVGKTELALYICEQYGTHYISVQTMIAETLRELRDTIDAENEKIRLKEEKEKAMEEGGGENKEDVEEEAEEEEEEEEVDMEELVEQLREIENTLEYSEDGKLPDENVVKMMKAYLTKNFCQNQGYVMDGYPKTMQQAIDLFGGVGDAGEEEEAEDEEGGEPGPPKILPDIVISLEATDEFLCSRIMEKPECEIQDTHYTEGHMLRRLETFRLNNTDDNTVLNYFNELEIHPLMIDVMLIQDVHRIFVRILPHLGSASGFGLTEKEERECYELEQEKKRLLIEEERIKKEIMEKEAAENYERSMEEWNKLLEEMQMEEEKMLVAQSEPLRTYLMKYVFPTLTKGLLEVAQRKPTDPVDFLAEYLFKENPEGHMFDPAYTRAGEIIEKKYKEQVDL